MSIWFWVFLVVFLILLAAFFSAAEIGMMSINRYRLRHLVKAKNPRAKLVQNQLDHPERLLSAVLIGNTLANILASMAMTFIGQRLYREAGVAIAEVILTITILVFAEMTPKTWAARFPEKASFNLIYPLRFFQSLLTPLIVLTTYLAHRLLACFGVSAQHSHMEKLSYDELRAVMHETDGLIPQEHQRMLIRLLDLQQAQVEDVMVPKNEIVGIDLSMPWMDVREQLASIQHTRIPLYQNRMEELIGVIHVRDILQLILNDDLNLAQLMKVSEKPIFIPAGTSLNTQILQFQAQKARSGFVVNEYGDLLGLVTLEDILEEIVGEFTTDATDLCQDVIAQSDNEYLVDASINLKQLERSLAWTFPQIGPRTLSGLIIEYLGYIPEAESCLRVYGYEITILRVSSQMIRSVRIKKISETGEEASHQ